jgi:hypothetical protein
MLDNKYTIHLVIMRNHPSTTKESEIQWKSPIIKTANSASNYFEQAAARIGELTSRFKRLLHQSKENNLQT